MVDEGVHEIQLRGKQLVFLFMALTTLLVVIFLCGVMVGRGVPGQRSGQTLEASADATADPTADAVGPRATTPPSSPSGIPEASDPSQEKLYYPNTLTGKDKDQEPPEILKEPLPAVDVRPNPARVVPTPTTGVPAPKPAKAVAAKSPPAAAVPSAVGNEPVGSGYVVQVAAVNDRREADTIARRLSGKGYPSFVTTPGAGTARVFRVRVGKYKDRRAADTIAKRLEREEQFKPWITK